MNVTDISGDLVYCAFTLGKVTASPKVMMGLTVVIAVIILRLIIWLIKSALEVYYRSKAQQAMYQYDPQGESVAPDVVRKVRNRKRWRVSRFAWWCALVLAAGMGIVLIWVVLAIWGAR